MRIGELVMPGNDSSSETALLLPGILLLLGLLYYGWPASGYFAAGLLASFMVASKKNAWTKAAASTLVGVNIGLFLITVILVIVNFVIPSLIMFGLVTPETVPGEIGLFEKRLLWLDAHLPSWTRLPVWAIIIVLAILTACSTVIPELKIVARFIWLKKWVGRVVAGVTVAASFTFFSDAAIFEPKIEEAYASVTVLFRDSKEREHKSIAKWLAIEALAQTVQEASPAVHNYYHELFETINHLQRNGKEISVWRKKIITADYITYRRNFYSNSGEKYKLSTQFPTPSKDRILDELSKQRELEAAATAKADDAEKGIREIISELVGLGGDEVNVLVDWLGDQMGYGLLGEGRKEAIGHQP
jgi:hypothetical protein